MKKKEFVEQIAEFCEFEGGPFSPETDLRSVEGYDSMAVLSMIAYIDENFSCRLPAEKFLNVTDFNSLIGLIGEEKFEDD